MTKAALKEREPALDLGMKDVTPKKQAEPSKAKSPTAKPTPAKPQPKPKNALAVRAPAKPPANVAPLNMLAVLANAASDPKCEPAKMRELYAIHKEMAQDQA